MAKTECCWYIGESLLPWEASVAGTLARALIRSGTDLHAYSGSGTDLLNIPGLLSWRSMHTMERATAAGIKGRLWHLWGTPPSWWGLVRLRARTVHTRFSLKTEWRGHPTVLSATEFSGGETYIPPAFEVKVNWGGDAPGETSPGEESLCASLRGRRPEKTNILPFFEAWGRTFNFSAGEKKKPCSIFSPAEPCSSWKIPFPPSPFFQRTVPSWAFRRRLPGRPSWMNSSGRTGMCILIPPQVPRRNAGFLPCFPVREEGQRRRPPGAMCPNSSPLRRVQKNWKTCICRSPVWIDERAGRRSRPYKEVGQARLEGCCSSILFFRRSHAHQAEGEGGPRQSPAGLSGLR